MKPRRRRGADARRPARRPPAPAAAAEPADGDGEGGAKRRRRGGRGQRQAGADVRGGARHGRRGLRLLDRRRRARRPAVRGALGLAARDRGQDRGGPDRDPPGRQRRRPRLSRGRGSRCALRAKRAKAASARSERSCAQTWSVVRWATRGTRRRWSSYTRAARPGCRSGRPGGVSSATISSTTLAVDALRAGGTSRLLELRRPSSHSIIATSTAGVHALQHPSAGNSGRGLPSDRVAEQVAGLRQGEGGVRVQAFDGAVAGGAADAECERRAAVEHDRRPAGAGCAAARAPRGRSGRARRPASARRWYRSTPPASSSADTRATACGQDR